VPNALRWAKAAQMRARKGRTKTTKPAKKLMRPQ
jgi:hypothetical protein